MYENGVKLCFDTLELCIKGYEKYRKVKDDSWAHIYWKISTHTLKFENNDYDLMSCEIEKLKEDIKYFLDGKMKEYECFVPIEEAFKVRFYPKGDEYGLYYESLEKKKLVKEPNMEIIIYPIEDNGTIDFIGVSFMLDMNDVKKFYDYLSEITK